MPDAEIIGQAEALVNLIFGKFLHWNFEGPWVTQFLVASPPIASALDGKACAKQSGAMHARNNICVGKMQMNTSHKLVLVQWDGGRKAVDGSAQHLKQFF